jgi:hypothetical protein
MIFSIGDLRMILTRAAGKALGLLAFLFLLAVGDAPNARAVQQSFCKLVSAA